AVQEQQFAEALAYKTPEHQQQNENSTKGETRVTHQTTTATVQSNEDAITIARELAGKAREYCRQQEALGNRITFAEAVFIVHAQEFVSGNGAAAAGESDDPIVVAKRLAAKARVYQVEQFSLGNRITIAQAVSHVSKQE